MDGRGQRRLARLVAGASLELSPRDAFAGAELRAFLPPGMTVFVTHSAGVSPHDIVAACAKLRRAGFVPVPHIAARRLASVTEASDYLRRVAVEAGVASVLVTAGDVERPAGPFADSLAVMSSGLIERHGVGHVLFAGHPEGHPRIACATLAAALARKVSSARARGLDSAIVSQFALEPAPLLRWLASLPQAGIRCPVHLGLAGPTRLAALAAHAVRCGSGRSLPALACRHASYARALTEASPDALLAALFVEEPASAAIAGLHIFTFGGLPRTAQWLEAWRRAA